MIKTLHHLILITTICMVPIISTIYDMDTTSTLMLMIVMTYGMCVFWLLFDCEDDNEKESETKNILKDNDSKYKTKNKT